MVSKSLEKLFLSILSEDEFIIQKLKEVKELDLPDCWIGAGFVRNKIWDYLHGFDLDNPEISKSLKESLLEGFMEDKLFIEEQQKLLEESPDFVPRFIEADEAFAHFRRVWERKLREENEANPVVQKENKKRIL